MSTDPTVSSVFGFPLLCKEASDTSTVPVAVGIELEVEGIRLPLRGETFEVKSDGTLRNDGVEIVSSGPMTGSTLDFHIEEIGSVFEDIDYSLSERCSTHIHLDVRDLTIKELYSFMACAHLFERVLFKLGDSDRTNSTFCTQATNNPCVVRALNQLREAASKEGSPCEEAMQEIIDIAPKYAACSLFRLGDLGTVEFRMFRPLVKPEELKSAVRFLGKVLRFSRTVSDPKEFIKIKKVSRLRQLFQACFPEEDYKEDFEESLEKGVQFLNDFLDSHEVKDAIKSRSEKFRLKSDKLLSEVHELNNKIRQIESGESLFGVQPDPK